MTILDPRTEETLRQSFKRYLNPFMLLMWRLGLGRWINLWPSVGGRILVIAHQGRRTGRRRYTPVNYALVDGEIYCTVGFGVVSDWYRNLAVNPNIEVWLPDGWWAGVVEDISDSPWRLPLLRQVLIGSGVVTYLAGIDPVNLTDEALHAVTSKYRLLHIWRTEARTGRGGPGDLAWVWPAATMILLPLLLFR
ncbi:MAG: hypothetical protein HW418_2930, partial [Anaerolineales bacterium]|nr:hypothetical protein [Anaerolineales bacterium]